MIMRHYFRKEKSIRAESGANTIDVPCDPITKLRILYRVIIINKTSGLTLVRLGPWNNAEHFWYYLAATLAVNVVGAIAWWIILQPGEVVRATMAGATANDLITVTCEGYWDDEEGLPPRP
jgi:hypothetical protein